MLRDACRFDNLSDVSCPACGAKGNFTGHGSYRRHLVTPDGESMAEIKRVRCASCGRTHAVLPQDVVPYRAFSETFVLSVLAAWAKGASNAQVRKRFGISESTRRRIVAQTRRRVCALLSCAAGRSAIHAAMAGVGIAGIPLKHLTAFGTRFAENVRLSNPHGASRSLSWRST